MNRPDNWKNEYENCPFKQETGNCHTCDKMSVAYEEGADTMLEWFRKKNKSRINGWWLIHVNWFKKTGNKRNH